MPLIAAARPGRDETFGPHPPPGVYALLALDHHDARLGVGGQLGQPVQRLRFPLRHPYGYPPVAFRRPLPEFLAGLPVLRRVVAADGRHQRRAGSVRVDPRLLAGAVLELPRLVVSILRWPLDNYLQVGGTPVPAVEPERGLDLLELAAGVAFRDDRLGVALT